MTQIKDAHTMRIGTGYDIHRFAEGRRLVLGGVHIPHDKGLLGHSDADVLSHAIADALLGAAGLPDIGHFFPNTDPSIEGIDSLEILTRVVSEIANHGWKPINVDSALIAEEPKVSPYLGAMKQCLSRILGLGVQEIGIKATTNEGIGELGRGAGIAAHAVCLVGPA